MIESLLQKECPVNQEVKRGSIYYADLNPVIGSEQGGERPVIVIQNNIGNKFSPTVIVAAITSHIGKAKLPTHVELPAKESGLIKESVVLLEQLRTIDKSRLKFKIADTSNLVMEKIDEALKISLGLC
ncbi:MAG: type II toxin-antitoxin system PemK/MazF family toxin [Clostridiales bacterium]|nr:type II toxin-antitoxin system PemK/MazF family toxin [Clostridiales bacterium]